MKKSSRVKFALRIFLIAYAVNLRKSKTGFVDSDIPPLWEADIEVAECLFLVPSAAAEGPGKQGGRRILGRRDRP